MTDLRKAAQQALGYMKSIGQMDMYPEDWAIVGRLEAALAQQEEPQGCATEEDCTKQPWCRIRGECQRKQAEPQPMPPEQRQRWEELAAMPQQAEPVNAAIEAVEETNAAAIRARSNT